MPHHGWCISLVAPLAGDATARLVMPSLWFTLSCWWHAMASKPVRRHRVSSFTPTRVLSTVCVQLRFTPIINLRQNHLGNGRMEDYCDIGQLRWGDLSTVDGTIPLLEILGCVKGERAHGKHSCSLDSVGPTLSFKLLMVWLSPLNYETKINPFSH